jgi:hypothetical protein
MELGLAAWQIAQRGNADVVLVGLGFDYYTADQDAALLAALSQVEPRSMQVVGHHAVANIARHRIGDIANRCAGAGLSVLVLPHPPDEMTTTDE